MARCHQVYSFVELQSQIDIAAAIQALESHRTPERRDVAAYVFLGKRQL